MKAADLVKAMERTVAQLAAFNEIAKALTSTLEVREVLGLVMQKVSALMKPSNWSLMLQDKEGKLYFEIAVGEGADRLRELKVLPGEGIAGTVFQTGLPRRVQNVLDDPAFARRFDDASEFRTHSILAVPLQSRGKVLGVIELVNGPNDPAFSDDDLLTVSGIADFAAIAIENAQNFQRVQELTLSDEHTGLFNARHLKGLLDQEVLRSHRFHHNLSLIFLDLDHFKQVNDTHGHLAGSGLLREVGTLLLEAIRQVDFAFRYGGDEFAVLLVETDAAGAKVIAERIRERFHERQFLFAQGLSVRLSASIGVATFPQDANSAMGLLEAADRAMYRVKARGKDGVESAGPASK